MLPGTTIGSYRIVGRLGAGGMGEVFRAEDTRLGRAVAIKVLPVGLAADPGHQRRFEQEARSLAALNHPNVLVVFDVGQHEGLPYLVCELLEGRNLREELNNNPLPVGRAVELSLQIARGLAAAHARGIVHRDLKPENIFLTHDGQVKILDFGLSKLLGTPGPAAATDTPPVSESAVTSTTIPTAPQDLTQPGRILGTPSYMSPEQVRGVAVDHRTDLFAFGCVLYEMLTGVRAFRRPSSAECLYAILHDEPPPVADGPGRIPPGLDPIVRHCLEKQPERRFQSTHDLVMALEDFRTSLTPPSTAPGASGPSPAVAPTPVPKRRRLPWWAVPAGLAALAAVLAGVLRWGAPDAPRITSLAVRPFDDFSGDSSQAYLSDGMTETLCAALGKIGALRVPGRSSVMRYKGTAKGAREMAQELDVQAIVEGSLQRTATNMLITVNLIDAAADRQIWSTNFQRDLGDFFVVQSEVARAIAHEVRIRLTPEDQARLGSARPVKRETVEACLLGMNAWWQWSDEGFTNALNQFRRATELDPDYAPGYAGEALTWAIGGSWVWRPNEVMPLAKAAAEKAIALDPFLADGYIARATCRVLYDWNWEGAEQDYKEGLRLSPNSSVALDLYHNMLMMLGRFSEAIPMLENAARHEPTSAALYSDLGISFYYSGQYDRAIPNLRRAIELSPDFLQAHVFLGWSHQFQGQASEALEQFELAYRVAPGSSWVKGALGYAYGRAGRRDDALRMLAAIHESAGKRYVPRLWQAFVYVGLGEHDQALDWLEKSAAEHDSQLIALKVSPVLAPLRNEPRFQRILKRMNLDR